MLQSQLGSIWVSSKIADIVREHEITSGSKKSLLYKIVKDKVSVKLNDLWNIEDSSSMVIMICKILSKNVDLSKTFNYIALTLLGYPWK